MLFLRWLGVGKRLFKVLSSKKLRIICHGVCLREDTKCMMKIIKFGSMSGKWAAKVQSWRSFGDRSSGLIF